MREIIANTLSKYDIGTVPKEALKYELMRASLKKEERVLSVDITLNFVVPIKACNEIKDAIAAKLENKLNGVELNFFYENIVLEEKELIELFIPHMIEIVNGEYASVTKSIQHENFQWDGHTLVLHAMGDFIVNVLNKEVKRPFELLLKQYFGISAQIEFKNDEELYAKERESFKNAEIEDIKKSVEGYKQELKVRASFKGETKSDDEPKKGEWKGDFKGGGRKREKELPAEGNRIMGKDIHGEPNVVLREIDPSQGMVIAEGTIFKMDFRLIKSGNYLMTLLLTDNTTTICTKAFVSETKHDEITSMLKAGDPIKIRGEVQYDTFENMNTIMIKDIEKREKASGRQDTWPDGKRVELHAHTKMSSMDGLNEPADIVNQAAA